jgi:nicotinate-nucleotide pyrophosphorylase (carboxylating)
MDRQSLILLKQALREDIGKGDITTQKLIPEQEKAEAVIIFREPAIICGLDFARAGFRLLDRKMRFTTRYKDGDKVKAGTKVAFLKGRARAILTAERVVLNFLSHLSGIATLTGKFVDQARPFKAKITDTRKTLPNLRHLQKYAVKCGGGYNHRFNLNEMVMIKDNHKQIRAGKTGLAALINEARKKTGKKIDAEVDNLWEYRQALSARPEIIMLDNMKIGDMKKAVKIRSADPRYHSVALEVSGNVGLNNVRQIARSGVDMISVGSLTHSSKGVDVSLEIKR